MKLRNAACEYADRGWAVFPLLPGEKRPHGALAPHGSNDATTDLATVFRWWQCTPSANIGIACQASGLVVIDVDPRNGGHDSMHELQRELGPLPVTVTSHSGGGGFHALFVDEQVTYRREIAPGVDIKANGYIVAPPSLHPSGAHYVWDVDGHPDEVAPARLPGAWFERMQARARRTTTPARTDSDDPLKNVPAAVYLPKLTSRRLEGDWVQCPFHRGGKERTPSLKADGTLWACYACEPLGDKAVMGGNVYDLAALLWGYGVPLSPVDFSIIRSRLARML